jgi:hypothetical protein
VGLLSKQHKTLTFSKFSYVMHGFIDQLGDLCCLVHNGYGAYEPHNKQWVKDRVFAHLKRMAQ